MTAGAPPEPRDRRLRVGVIGAGVSGLYMAERLKTARYDFAVYEKAAEIGGTWRDNTYPGLHVDVVSRSYEFPFRRNPDWSHRYAPGPEIQRYLLEVARSRGLRDFITFNTEISQCRLRDGRWELVTPDGRCAAFDAVVCATGVLRVPRIPALPGLESFAGPAFHSSRWDHTAPVAGQRVGVIGMGSSGIQIVAKLGQDGVDVTHFIRTPQWIQVKANPSIGRAERFLLRHSKKFGELWDRYLWRSRTKADGSERWRLEPGPERDTIVRRFHQVLEEQIADPELRRALTPADPVGCKRVPKSPDYYQVVQRPNVHPVFGGITQVVPEGVIDAAGTLHGLDTLVLATGFNAQAYMRPMTVAGADGHTIEDLWRDGPFSYRGVGLPGFPNFFLLSGPFSPINSVAVTLSLESETSFVLELLAHSQRQGGPVAPSATATRKFLADVAAAMPRTTYSLCSNWYTGSGRLPLVWPWTRAEYRAQFDHAEQDFTPSPADAYQLTD
jgi:cation diffusion facilitator CzcD-associated flavoprotein CzcO